LAFVTLANTIEAWRREILNYARTGGASNGFAESLKHPSRTKSVRRMDTGLGKASAARCCGPSARSSTPTPVRSRLYDLFREAKEQATFARTAGVVV